MKRSNYHTHTVYCDGKDSPRELVERALELGCPQIGFSGHSYTETGDERPYCMTREDTAAYKKEIRALREEYSGRITILLGVERDFFFKEDTDGYDYVIGSVHYVFKDGLYLPVDESEDIQRKIVREHYNGDFYAFAEDYFALVGEVATKTDCDIVGHFDLISKFNEAGDLFDPQNERYRKAADAALDRLLGRGLTFEINYGAVRKGLRSEPYPEKRILDKLRQRGEKTILSSDCHDRRDLLFGIEEDNVFVPRKAVPPAEKDE